MNYTKLFFNYGPLTFFLFARLPDYANAEGILWSDVVIGGLLPLLGGFIYDKIYGKDDDQHLN